MTSKAPGQVPTPHSLLPASSLTAATEVQLAHTAAAVIAEQHRRALADNDIDALLEQAFVDGFAGNGQAGKPWLVAGLLVCPGYVRYKSASSHECQFVSIGGVWVWEHDQIVVDTMRQLPGAKMFKQSISIVTMTESMEVDVVQAASKSGGGCQMRRATSYQVRAGELVEVSTRARAPQGHSR